MRASTLLACAAVTVSLTPTHTDAAAQPRSPYQDVNPDSSRENENGSTPALWEYLSFVNEPAATPGAQASPTTMRHGVQVRVWARTAEQVDAARELGVPLSGTSESMIAEIQQPVIDVLRQRGLFVEILNRFVSVRMDKFDSGGDGGELRGPCNVSCDGISSPAAIPDDTGPCDCLTVGPRGFATVTISGCDNAVVCDVEYRLKIQHSWVQDVKAQLNNEHHAIGSGFEVWFCQGSQTDGGEDDDPEDDTDIELGWDQTGHFDGDPVNGEWRLDAWDMCPQDTGFIEFVEFRVYYDAPGQPDLAPYRLPAWNNSIPVGITQLSGNSTHDYSGPYYDDQVLYINGASGNFGNATAANYAIKLEVVGLPSENQLLFPVTTEPGFATFWATDAAIGPLPAGPKTIRLTIDEANVIAESDETNNSYERTINVQSSFQAPTLVGSGCVVNPTTAGPGDSITAFFQINNPNSTTVTVGLGSSIIGCGVGQTYDSPGCDTYVNAPPGQSTHSRCFNIPANAEPEDYDVVWCIWETIGVGQPWDCFDRSCHLHVEHVPTLDELSRGTLDAISEAFPHAKGDTANPGSDDLDGPNGIGGGGSWDGPDHVYTLDWRGGDLQLALFFAHSSSSDLDIFLWGNNTATSLLDQGISTTDFELIKHPGLAAGRYYVTIDGYQGDAAPYFLRVGRPRSGITVLVHGFKPTGKGPIGGFDPLEDYWENGRSVITPILLTYGGGTAYKYNRFTGDFEPVPVPGTLDDPAGHVVLVHNWAAASNDAAGGYAEAAADALFAAMVEHGYVDPGAGTSLAELHLVGHSRGASVVSELTQRLGMYGIPVDYLTLLDNHDFDQNEMGCCLFDGDMHDPASQVWTNVLYADNFWQNEPTTPVTVANPIGRELAHLLDGWPYDQDLDGLPADGWGEPHGHVIDWYAGTIWPNSQSTSWYTNPDHDSGFSRWIHRGGFDWNNPSNEGILSRADPETFDSLVPFPTAGDGDDDFASTSFVTGTFDLADLDPLTGSGIAGWEYHGGGGTGHIANDGTNRYLELDVDNYFRRHNRMVIPPNALFLNFRLWVRSPRDNTFLIVYLDDGSVNTPLGNPISLSSGTGYFTDRSLPVPGLVQGTVQTVTFEVTDGGLFGTPEVGIDDIDFVVCSVPPAPNNADADPREICVGESSVLTATAPGAVIDWYLDECGGGFVATGGSVAVTPSESTAYYALARDPVTGCVSDTCDSVVVTVYALPTSPSNPNANPPEICEEECSTISASVSSGVTIDWFAGGCDGAPVGSGVTLQVCPTTTTTYYGRARNMTTGCVSSTCAQVTVTVDLPPARPSNPQANPPSICASDCSTVSASVPGGQTIDWFTGGCDGQLIGTGTSVSVCPTTTTTYYARARNLSTGCVSADCATATVTVGPLPATPDAWADPPDVCEGESTTLHASAGSGETVDWYSDSCGSGLLGSGTQIVVSPTMTTTYYARARDATSGCQSAACDEVTVVLLPLPTITGWDIAGSHGAAGEIALPVADNYIEARACVDRLHVTFDTAMDPNTFGASGVTVVGASSGGQPVCDVVLDGSGTQMTITLCSPLPDVDSYTVTVSDTVTDLAGCRLGGDRVTVVGMLVGDVNADHLVDNSDLIAVRIRRGTPVTEASAIYDVNCDGVIDNSDLIQVRIRRGNTLP